MLPWLAQQPGLLICVHPSSFVFPLLSNDEHCPRWHKQVLEKQMNTDEDSPITRVRRPLRLKSPANSHAVRPLRNPKLR